MKTKILIGVLACIALIFATLYFSGSGVLGAAGRGPTHYQTENFLQGAYFGTTGQSRFTNAGGLSVNGEVGFGANNCSQVTWNPGAVTFTAVATTSVAMPSGFTAGDILLPSFTSTSTGASEIAVLKLDVGLTGATSSQVLAQLSVPSSTIALSINPATGTLSVCYIDVP